MAVFITQSQTAHVKVIIDDRHFSVRGKYGNEHNKNIDLSNIKAMTFAPIGAGKPVMYSGYRLWQRYATRMSQK